MRLLPEDQEELITRIEVAQRDCILNDWEESFLDSILEQVGKGFPLTEAQEDKLGEIESDDSPFVPFRVS